MDKDVLFNKVIDEKVMNTRFLEASGKCSGQLSPDDRSKVVNDLYNIIGDNSTGAFNYEDLKTGFMLYSLASFCDLSAGGKFHNFLFNLLSTETPRTIVKTMINSIESGKFLQKQSKLLFCNFSFFSKKGF